jgi:hypothetical protein
VICISRSAAPADVRAAPQAKARNAALDRPRTFLTLVALFRHAVVSYIYFGHADPKFVLGFDTIVLAIDSFFMAMFFFVGAVCVAGNRVQGTAALSHAHVQPDPWRKPGRPASGAQEIASQQISACWLGGGVSCDVE